MIITNKQAMIMFDTLKETLKLHDNGNIFTWDYETRKQMVNVIINQQSNLLINLDKEEIIDDDPTDTTIS